MKNELISVGKIEELFELNRLSNNAYEANVILQVVAFSHNVSENRSFYSFTLSDSIYKYAGFIYLKELSNENHIFEANDLIRLKKFSISELTNKGSKVIFIVKDVDFYGKLVELIGNPEEYKEKSAAEKELKKSQDEMLNMYNNTRGNVGSLGNNAGPPINKQGKNNMNNLNNMGSVNNYPNMGNYGNPDSYNHTSQGSGQHQINSNLSTNNNNFSPENFKNGLYDYSGNAMQQNSINSMMNQVMNPINQMNPMNPIASIGPGLNQPYNYQGQNKFGSQVNPNLILNQMTPNTKNHKSPAKSTSNSKRFHYSKLKLKTNEITPLNELTTFSKNFSIQVRILKKTDLIPFSKNESQGVLISFNVLDSSGIEMEIKAFNSTAERSFSQMNENSIYKIYGLYVKLNDRKYSSIKSDFCLILEDYFTIEQVDDDNSIKPFSFKFIQIIKLNEINLGTTVDVLARVTEEGDVHILNTKNGERPIKRIKIADETEYEIELSLWGDHSQIEFGLYYAGSSDDEKYKKYEKNENTINLSNNINNSNPHNDNHSNNHIEKVAKEKNIIIVAFKNVYVSEFNGFRTLNTTNKSIAYVDPKIKEVDNLKTFFSNYTGELKNINKSHKEEDLDEKLYTFQDCIKHLQSFSNYGSFADRGKVMKVKAIISDLIHTDKNYYIGCCECRRKMKDVLNLADFPSYQCPYCKKDHETPFYIYAFIFKAKDSTGECLLDLIGEVGNNILGMAAEAYRQRFLEHGETKVNELVGDLKNKEFYFYLRPRLNYYNGESKKKLSVVKAELINIEEDYIIISEDEDKAKIVKEEIRLTEDNEEQENAGKRRNEVNQVNLTNGSNETNEISKAYEGNEIHPYEGSDLDLNINSMESTRKEKLLQNLKDRIPIEK